MVENNENENVVEKEVSVQELGQVISKYYMDALSIKSDDDFKVSKWNVVDDNTFKNRICTVFKQVSDALSKTLGPYGSTTIIEKFGEMYITKDGWQVLKAIRFDSPIDNNIMMMLVRIATQVVLKVGDGSTSSIVAANNLLDKLNNDDVLSTMRPKEFIDILDECVDIISKEIYKNANKVDTESFDEIYKLAYISTNGDEEISNIIRDIYKQTKNPSIDYVKSKDETTRYEIVNGYKADIGYLDSIFSTQDDGNAVIDNPFVVVFNYKIDTGNSLKFIGKCVEYSVRRNRRLVVVAPAYDKYLVDYIRQQVIADIRSNGYSHTIYTRASLVSNLSHDLYNDFIVMCGANALNEEYLDNLDFSTIDDNLINDYIGEVERFTVNDKTTLVEGFVRRNENMYDKVINDAYAKYMKLEQESTERSIIDTTLNGLKQRLAKLKGSMGIIHVGGYTTIEKGANYDLVEDAVRACESAYNHGYNIGGSLIIPCMINKILKEMRDDDPNYNNKSRILRLIQDSFIEVFERVMMNKSEDIEYDELIETCIKNNTCYDLVREEYSNEIINSCITDIEILKAAVSIISLLISSNQYISIQTKN